MLITMKCPSCGSNLEVDATREFMFCQYCGTKIMNAAEKVEISGSVNIDNSRTIQNLLKRAEDFEKTGRINESYSYYNQVLDIDCNCTAAINGVNRTRMIVTEPNVFITFRCIVENVILQTSINNANITRYRNGDRREFILKPGNYVVKFKIGSKRYANKFTIVDRNSRINIQFTHDKRNHIDIF